MRHQSFPAAPPLPLSTQQLLIENAANRLLLRTIVAHLIEQSPGADQLVRGLRRAAETLSTDIPGIGEMPAEMQKAAVVLVRNRADAFLADFEMPFLEAEAA